MSYLDRLIHPLLVVTAGDQGDPEDEDDLDGYGHVAAGTPTEIAVHGLIQPKTVRELANLANAGAELSDHTIFLPSMRLSGAAHITDDPANGRRFEIVGIRSFEFGRSPHLEVDAKLVGSTEGPSVPGS